MIINSLLDSDAYKFSMQNVVFKKFPDVDVEFAFKNRTKSTKLGYSEYAHDIQKEIDHLCTLRFKEPELLHIYNKGYYGKGYIELLRNFKFNPEYIKIYDAGKDTLGIKMKGNWQNTILFEVPVLAIVSETYTNHTLEKLKPGELIDKNGIGLINLENKITKFNKYCIQSGEYVPFIDFGTRRRFSFDWQDEVIRYLLKHSPKSFVGTSNEYFAMKHGIKGMGTMAHEYIQAMQALVRLKDSQKFAFQTWADVYRGDLGIALSDTLGMNAFFKDFDLYFSKLFDGARHDSGDPFVWGDKLIQHYESMRIDPMTKTAVFSDGLNFEKIADIHKAFCGMIKCSFGIGTNLTNDCSIKPLQIVIKMVKCNSQHVAKISDSPGKQMCEDPEYLKYLATQFDIRRDNLNE